MENGFAAERFLDLFFKELMMASVAEMAASISGFFKIESSYAGRRGSVEGTRKIENIIEIISPQKILTIAHVLTVMYSTRNLFDQ
jgi:hypothetical protein